MARKMEKSICSFCNLKFDGDIEAIKHCIEDHEEQEITFLTFSHYVTLEGKTHKKYKRKSFGVVGKNIRGDLNGLAYTPESAVLKCPRTPIHADARSPMDKVRRINTPMKDVHVQSDPELEILSVENECEVRLEDATEDDHMHMLRSDDEQYISQATSRLQQLLPHVIPLLSENGRLPDWMAFFELVASGNFDVGHIVCQLFLDVVKFKTAGNVHAMRFTQEVKEFWNVGYSLFHSKFIRFMGGYKALGQLSTDKMQRENLDTECSKINFVCPAISLLKEDKKKRSVNCKQPGIISDNIDTVTKVPGATDKSYNICFDGKKIATGFGKSLGEVDLFGHESEPTLKEKQNRFEVEGIVVLDMKTLLQSNLEIDNVMISDLNETTVQQLCSFATDLLSIFSYRIKELRRQRVAKSMTLDKLMKSINEPWQKSKYSYAISAVKTQLHDIDLNIDEALQLNGQLGFIISGCNRSERVYSLDKRVALEEQDNYVCLRELTSMDENTDSSLVKQRTEHWHKIRDTALVTGSTMHKAAGISTLKEQREHFDPVVSGIEIHRCRTKEQADAMRHGTENELNAIGTLVAKVLPVFAPQCKYFEEGCYVLDLGERTNAMVISPDGSCRRDSIVQFGIEVKCPVPGKLYTTDVHYSLPKYYVCQILSEMAALKCSSLFYLSWTIESTTVMKASFDEELWTYILMELNSTYNPDGGQLKRPVKKSPNAEIIKQKIDTYVSEKVVLLCEFPSHISSVCKHSNVQNTNDIHGFHKTEENSFNTHEKKRLLCVSEMMKVAMKAEIRLKEMYKIQRIPAKEVLLAVLSDLDRQKSQGGIHGVPIAYGLSGYSLTTETMRTMINDVLCACRDRNIMVRSISTDGQFYKLCVRNHLGEPLTVLQLAKDTWEKTKKQNKTDQVKTLMELNRVHLDNKEDMAKREHEIREKLDSTFEFSLKTDGSVLINSPIRVKGWKGQEWPTLFNPPRLVHILTTNSKHNSEEPVPDVEDMEVLLENNDILYNKCDRHESSKYESSSIVTMEVDLTETAERDDQISEDTNTTEVIDSTSSLKTVEKEDVTLSVDDMKSLIEDLKTYDTKRKNPKWSNLTGDKLLGIISSEPFVLGARMTKLEVRTCGSYFLINRKSNIELEKMSKMELLNEFAKLFGHDSRVQKTKSPRMLRTLIKDLFARKFTKEALNAIMATRSFLETELPQWRQRGIFRDGISVGPDEHYTWYSQPHIFPGIDHPIAFLLDAHHLFVNARCYVCQNGISTLNVNKEAWLDVSDPSKCENTGLNKAMVVDLIDRQSNGIAQVVFSEKVESAMRTLGWTSEAQFCKTIREWYMAEDEPGLKASERYVLRMNMRNMLLRTVRLAEFPPPGLHVGGMPIVMFEGLLTNIDRRIQLYALTPEKTYNVRSPNTLDVENLFSGFKDLDPKSTGVLLADDIPHALETASYLMKTRLDPERPFLMRTGKSDRVYPANALHQSAGDRENQSDIDSSVVDRLENISKIEIRDHEFDLKLRTRKPRRKVVFVPDIGEPARGTQPVRQYHKSDASKILPHIRHGLQDNI